MARHPLSAAARPILVSRRDVDLLRMSSALCS